jgi:hypothetical protein
VTPALVLPLLGTAPNQRPSMPTANTTFEFGFEGLSLPTGWSTGITGTAWSRAESGTPTSRTGPIGAHEGDAFVFVEADAPRAAGDIFDLSFACDFGDSLQMSWWYHMYGQRMGSLAVRSGTGALLWEKRSDQGDAWQYASVAVPTSSFTFEATRGAGKRSDAAIDDVTISCLAASPPASPPAPPSPPSPPSMPVIHYTFEEEDTDWSTGPTVTPVGPESPATERRCSAPLITCRGFPRSAVWQEDVTGQPLGSSPPLGFHRRSGSVPSISTFLTSGRKADGFYYYAEARPL